MVRVWNSGWCIPVDTTFDRKCTSFIYLKSFFYLIHVVMRKERQKEAFCLITELSDLNCTPRSLFHQCKLVFITYINILRFFWSLQKNKMTTELELKITRKRTLRMAPITCQFSQSVNQRAYVTIMASFEKLVSIL